MNTYNGSKLEESGLLTSFFFFKNMVQELNSVMKKNSWNKLYARMWLENEIRKRPDGFYVGILEFGESVFI